MTLHKGEFQIDPRVVRRLLRDQLPQWADLLLRRLDTSGTVNAMFRLGDGMLVRLPRTPEFSAGPQREAHWLPVFASELPLEVPDYVTLGTPTEWYPSHWSVLGWIEGTNATASTVDSLDEAARTLADFVVALRGVSTLGAPEGGSYRGFGLAKADRSFRRWTARLPADVDRGAVLRSWEACLEAGEWTGPPTWFHSDLHSANLLARNGALVAVIDWEGVTVGDPSSDYVAAWWLFDAKSRETFRRAVQAHDADWRRGMGWALHMAVAAIPYYTDTNPAFAAQARRALNEVMVDG